ncbi:hypothetical protein NQ315_005304 [Exocentrus adspersus]|uniref:Uncharacterized protein n=1 Tax=Exocentrus adspersus TaxID=1586481 RepID=A0AAV8W2W7_9CUCU|nr:hypothetical protein NQ315_005304 [Exocentrus adspersus]
MAKAFANHLVYDLQCQICNQFSASSDLKPFKMFYQNFLLTFIFIMACMMIVLGAPAPRPYPNPQWALGYSYPYYGAYYYPAYGYAYSSPYVLL